MLDISIVSEISQEANWNEWTGRRIDGHNHVLSQADALTKKKAAKAWKALNIMISDLFSISSLF